MEDEDRREIEEVIDRETASRFHEYNTRRGIEQVREVKEFALRATGGR